MAGLRLHHSHAAGKRVSFYSGITRNMLCRLSVLSVPSFLLLSTYIFKSLNNTKDLVEATWRLPALGVPSGGRRRAHQALGVACRLLQMDRAARLGAPRLLPRERGCGAGLRECRFSDTFLFRWALPLVAAMRVGTLCHSPAPPNTKDWEGFCGCRTLRLNRSILFPAEGPFRAIPPPPPQVPAALASAPLSSVAHDIEEVLEF